LLPNNSRSIITSVGRRRALSTPEHRWQWKKSNGHHQHHPGRKARPTLRGGVVTRSANSIRQHSFIDTLDGKFERPSQLAAAPSHLIDAETG
jgi:hypothetical protein